ncbi:MAG: hypothetical protein AAB911_02250 [Patescibacteria group bacterium]
MSQKFKIGVVGLGMVGDTIRRWFEEIQNYKRGKELFCYDTDAKKGYGDDYKKADIVFVSVPTPSNPDGSCNTSIVKSVVAEIPDGKTVVIKSTVEPGTAEELQKKYPKKYFIFNPEFLTESQAWSDFIDPDRQIVGHTEKSKSFTSEVANLLPDAFFVSPGTKNKDCYGKVRINATEAEIGKYAANVFGYIKVVFGNILADLAHATTQKFKNEGIEAVVNYDNIKEMLGHDKRIGLSWLNVNHGNFCGAGGFCFPKDMNAFIHFTEKLIKTLKKTKKSDKGLAQSLEAGLRVLTSVHDYNVQLLKWQGLDLEEVSYHNNKLQKEPKKIRVLEI